MNNEYYGAASTPTEDFLAHYGVKGMKWGVRKAIASGNARRLGRQYNKAAKKLAKLEKRAASGKKYAKRAAALGVGAAAAGGLAALGTGGIVNVMGQSIRGTRTLGNKLMDATKGRNDVASKAVRGAGLAMIQHTRPGSKLHNVAAKGASKLNTWGNSNSISKGAAELYGKAAGKMAGGNAYAQKAASDMARGKATKALGGVSNNTIARAGMAAVGAGLGAGAAYNAYRAATTKRAAKKAAQFRSEMNKAFAGTAYANGRPASQKKRRRR